MTAGDHVTKHKWYVDDDDDQSPARSESLYRHSYPGPVVRCTYHKLYHRFRTVLSCGNANCEGVVLLGTVTENGETSCYSNWLIRSLPVPDTKGSTLVSWRKCNLAQSVTPG